MSVKLVSITHPKMDGLKTAEELISYCARVSNPSNQMNMDSSSKLISYLIKHKQLIKVRFDTFFVVIYLTFLIPYLNV